VRKITINVIDLQVRYGRNILHGLQKRAYTCKLIRTTSSEECDTAILHGISKDWRIQHFKINLEDREGGGEKMRFSLVDDITLRNWKLQ
jgi:hypothetical protein